MEQGHTSAAKALLKEAKMDEKKVKAQTVVSLSEAFSSFSAQK